MRVIALQIWKIQYTPMNKLISISLFNLYQADLLLCRHHFAINSPFSAAGPFSHSLISNDFVAISDVG